MPVRRLLPLLLAGALCTSVAAWPVERASAEPSGEVHVSTDLNGALEMARRGLAMDRPDVTASIARQILATVPNDSAAHMLLAAALTRIGVPGQAIPVAKAGFRLAKGKEARFEGAYLTAEAMAAAGRPWGAKLWLRKADLYASSKSQKAVLGKAYGSVSAQSRIGFGMALFGGPSRNVNGGSLHDTFWFFGIPIPITQALPGQVFGFSGQVDYRLNGTTQARLGWAHREVVLGDKARAIDPLARASDYRQDEVTLGLNHVWQDAEGRLAVLTSGSIARRWTGGETSADIASAALEVRHALAQDWTVTGRAELESVHIPRDGVADSLTSRLSFAASHRADWLGALTAQIGAVDVASDAAGIAWRGPSLAVAWRPPIRSEAFGLTLDLQAESRDYWRSPAFDNDTWVSMSLTAELTALSVMGFNPRVTVSTARTRSDVVVRDTKDTGISFGISSQF